MVVDISEPNVNTFRVFRSFNDELNFIFSPTHILQKSMEMQHEMRPLFNHFFSGFENWSHYCKIHLTKPLDYCNVPGRDSSVV